MLKRMVWVGTHARCVKCFLLITRIKYIEMFLVFFFKSKFSFQIEQESIGLPPFLSFQAIDLWVEKWFSQLVIYNSDHFTVTNNHCQCILLAEKPNYDVYLHRYLPHTDATKSTKTKIIKTLSVCREQCVLSSKSPVCLHFVLRMNEKTTFCLDCVVK